MNRGALVLALAVAAVGCEKAHDAQTVTFPPDMPKVGDKQTKSEDMQMTLTVGSGPEMVMTKQEQVAREALAVDGERVTKAKLTYVTRREARTLRGSTTDKPSALAGKSYIVTGKGADLDATYADGSAVPADELAELRKANKRFGEQSAMDRIVATKTWKTGEKVAFTPAELNEVNQENEARGSGERIEALTLTLTSVDAGVAKLAMGMTMKITSDKGSFEMKLDGGMRVDVARGRLLEAAGKGPVEGNIGAPLHGTVTMKTANTY